MCLESLAVPSEPLHGATLALRGGVCDPGSLTGSSHCLQKRHLLVPHCAGAVGVLLSHSQLLCSLLEAAGLRLGLVLAEHSFGVWLLLGW